MRVKINKARRDELTIGIDYFFRRRAFQRTDRDDALTLRRHIRPLPRIPRAVNHATAYDKQIVHCCFNIGSITVRPYDTSTHLPVADDSYTASTAASAARPSSPVTLGGRCSRTEFTISVSSATMPTIVRSGKPLSAL